MQHIYFCRKDRSQQQFMKTNLNAIEAKYRLYMGLIMLRINIIVTSIMLHFQLPQYWAFVSFLGWFGTCGYLLASKRKTCPSKAYFGVSLLPKGSISENRLSTFNTNTTCQIALQDIVVLSSIRRRAKGNLLTLF